MKNLDLFRFLCQNTAVVPPVHVSEDIFEFKIGNAAVWTLVELRREGNLSILLDAEDEIKHYLPERKYNSAINFFLVKRDGKLTLIDTGLGGAIHDRLDSLGISPKDISTVLITHAHGDHTGGLSKDGKPLFPNADVYISNKEWDAVKGNNAMAEIFNSYGPRFHTFESTSLDAIIKNSAHELIPGIYSLASEGHTPGHTSFIVEDEGNKLIVFGDLLHVQNLQFAAPYISVSFDSNPRQSAKTRQEVLEYAAENKIPIAGMHLVYPAAGFVEKPSGAAPGADGKAGIPNAAFTLRAYKV